MLRVPSCMSKQIIIIIRRNRNSFANHKNGGGDGFTIIQLRWEKQQFYKHLNEIGVHRMAQHMVRGVGACRTLNPDIFTKMKQTKNDKNNHIYNKNI